MAKKINSIKNHRFDLYVDEDAEEVYIYLKSYLQKKDGTILLSPDCVAPIELDAQADMLIEELQSLKKRANPYFTKWFQNRKYPYWKSVG